MNFLGHDWTFWAAILGAAVVKLFSSPYHSILRAALTVFAAVFAASVFTEPALDWLRLNPEVYKVPVAAVIALTGEGAMRAVIEVSLNPQKWIETIISKRLGK